MKEYTIRPVTEGNKQILTDDLVIQASTILTAKEKAKMQYPGAFDYIIINEEFTGWAGIQRQREKSGFGM